MKGFFLFFGLSISLFSLVSCDDGDFDNPSFEFEATNITQCNDAIYYNVSSNSTEALLVEPNFGISFDSLSKVATRTQNTIPVTYRVFTSTLTNANNYFCQNIPPTSPGIAENWMGTANLTVTNTIVLNDNDGIDLESEVLDTDGDSFPNFIDIDDDGDGISTRNEDINGDGNPANDDTDNDGTPNYLDNDDDNDGTLTNLESTNQDDDNDTLVNYLDPDTTTPLNAERTLINTYSQTYSLLFVLDNLSLTNGFSTIRYESFNLGTLTGNNNLNFLLP